MDWTICSVIFLHRNSMRALFSRMSGLHFEYPMTGLPLGPRFLNRNNNIAKLLTIDKENLKPWNVSVDATKIHVILLNKLLNSTGFGLHLLKGNFDLPNANCHMQKDSLNQHFTYMIIPRNSHNGEFWDISCFHHFLWLGSQGRMPLKEIKLKWLYTIHGRHSCNARGIL